MFRDNHPAPSRLANMSKKHFTINCKLYKLQILVCIGTSPKETAILCGNHCSKQPWWDYQNAGLKMTEQLLDEETYGFAAGKVFYAPTPLMWIRSADDLRTMVHECVHLAYETLCARGVIICRDNDEPLTYLVEHLFSQLLRKAKRMKK